MKVWKPFSGYHSASSLQLHGVHLILFLWRCQNAKVVLKRKLATSKLRLVNCTQAYCMYHERGLEGSTRDPRNQTPKLPYVETQQTLRWLWISSDSQWVNNLNVTETPFTDSQGKIGVLHENTMSGTTSHQIRSDPTPTRDGSSRYVSKKGIVY